LKPTGERFVPPWPPRPLTADEGVAWHEHAHRYLLAREHARGAEVLDIASGEGFGAAMLSDTARRVTALDIDPRAVAHARAHYGSRSNLHFAVGSCLALPLASGSVDVITSFETLEHVARHDLLVAEFARVLRPDGLVLISTPDRSVYSTAGEPGNPYHVKELDRREFESLMRTRFRSVTMMGQQVRAASWIVPLNGTTGDGSAPATAQPQVRYLIAICTNSPAGPPARGAAAVFADPDSDPLEAALRERDLLRAARHDLHDALETIQRSQAFRIGRAIAKPAVLLRPLLRRPRLSGEPPEDHGRTRGLHWLRAPALPSFLTLGRGNLLVVHGTCAGDDAAIGAAEVAAVGDGKTAPRASAQLLPTGPDTNAIDVWATLPFPADTSPGRISVELRVRFRDGRVTTLPAGSVEIGGGPGRQVAVSTIDPHGPPLVAICMATCNPPLAYFRQQIESLRAQTHSRWHCIVSDDASDERLWREMTHIIGGDPRFRLHRHSARVGFFRNFERCLSLVGDDAGFVALCDQDDEWHREKLAASLAAFEADTTLVYTDMVLVDDEDRTIAPSLYEGRMNNGRDLPSLITANSVAGAALMFRRSLLDDALPFPDLPGHAFHDHWIAATALARGRLAFVDRPLYRYRQHAGNVIGGARAVWVQLPTELRSFAYLLQQLLGAPHNANYFEHLRELYASYVARPAVMARALLLRVPDMAPAKRAGVSRLSRINTSVPALLRETLMRRPRDPLTLGYHLLTLRLEASRRLLLRVRRLARRTARVAGPAASAERSPTSS
jgi:SAM-dependent methyltransferase/glycosyltransferase involved in cell wall biosynthesis